MELESHIKHSKTNFKRHAKILYKNLKLYVNDGNGAPKTLNS